MTNHIPDPEKMVCRHAPREPVAAFYYVCKHCHAPIDAVHCKRCDGTGFRCNDPLGDCKACKGSGVARWEVAKP